MIASRIAPTVGISARSNSNVIIDGSPCQARGGQRKVVWLNPPGPGLTVVRATQADTHPNIAVRVAAASTVPLRLLRWWSRAGHRCIILDTHGRYTKIDLPASTRGYVDMADASRDDLRGVLQGRLIVTTMDFSQVPTLLLSTALRLALSLIAEHREQTGRRDWMMIDSAETVLDDPGIPAGVLDLPQRGYCLVMRSAAQLSDLHAADIDFVVGGLGGSPPPNQPESEHRESP